MIGQALILCDGGALSHCNALRTHWLPTLKVGLFQNDWTPQRNSVIGHVVPATFSGYGGLHFCYGWQAPTLAGHVATTQAGHNAWTHNGGAVGNWIFGYYVVDQAGALQWAQRDPDGPVDVSSMGFIYRLVLYYAVASRFTE